MLFHKTIIGQVIRGSGAGKKLGFPTINLACTGLKLPFGVYSVKVYTGGEVYLGALHYGPRKIFGLMEPILEVHLIGFDGDLYSQKVRIKILKFIRDTMDFDNTDALKKQIELDVQKIVNS